MADDLTGISVSAIGINPNPVASGSTMMVSVTIREVLSKLVNVPASSWTGTGPYTVTVSSEIVTTTSELMAYVDCTATAEQRKEEVNAGIRIGTVSSGTVQLIALNRKPLLSLPIRIIQGVLPTMVSRTVPASSWTGTGPWTATVNVGTTVNTAIVGVSEDSDTESARQIHACGIHAAGASGATVTLRALIEKPTSAVTLTIGAM